VSGLEVRYRVESLGFQVFGDESTSTKVHGARGGFTRGHTHTTGN